MVRSATDATRFTSTTPHATGAPNRRAAKPFYPQAANPGHGPKIVAEKGPAGETPQQKVARLRAAAARAREGKVTTFDKAVMRGRVWADRAHKVTALGLIGITGIAGAVTIYALGDMIIYNRKKKAEYFAEQKALAVAALASAEEALAKGTATEEQLQILIRENKFPNAASINDPSYRSITESTDFQKAQAAADQAKSKIVQESKGVWATAKGWMFSGLKKEEESEDETARFGYEGTSEDDDVMGERSSDIARAVAAKKMELENKARLALDKEIARERGGGPLDRIGTQNEGDNAGVRTESEDGAVGQKSGGGWTSFMTTK